MCGGGFRLRRLPRGDQTSSRVTPPRLAFKHLNNQLVLSWTNAGFNLQSAPTLTGTFTNIPAATSPYTNTIIAPQKFFRWRRRSCDVQWYGQPTPPRSLAIHHPPTSLTIAIEVCYS